MARETVQLPLSHRRYVRPAPTWRWPRSPRPIAQETLSSYSIRLGASYGLRLADVFDCLGIPKSVEPHVLEQEPTRILTERLTATTGRPRERFEMLQFAPAETSLAAWERTGFCPECWLERRSEHSAYLARAWSQPPALICPRHKKWLHEWDRVDRWPDLFNDRAQWTRAAREALPNVWQSVCASLALDPHAAAARLSEILIGYEDAMRAWDAGRRLPPGVGVFNDLSCYLQVQWNPAERLVQLGKAVYSIHEAALCCERSVRGSLSMRLATLISASHMLEMLANETESDLAKLIFDDARRRAKNHVEYWWICHRTLRWPKFLRERFFDAVGIESETGSLEAMPPFDSCRTCVRGAPQLHRAWLYVYLDESFRCRIEDGYP